MGRIQIVSNGHPDSTTIVAVDDEGRETPLDVEGFEVEMHADRKYASRLALTGIYGNVVRLDIPASGDVVATLTSSMSRDATMAALQAPVARPSERAAAIAVLRLVCAKYGDNDWPDGLHLADVIAKHLEKHLDLRVTPEAP